jgi:WD40 repeat protein
MPDKPFSQQSTRSDPAAGPIEHSTPQLPNHELLRCIGSGGFGEVWLARNIMGTYRAVKFVYRRSFSDERPYEREFRGLQKFEPISRSHDGFVDILDTGLNAVQGYFYYVMELADDVVSGTRIDPSSYEPKTLDKEAAKSGCVPVQTCVSLGVSLSAALSHLHHHGLLHRDIKPSNIIFVNGIPKIADIGLVTKVEGTQTFSGGTAGYYPVEEGAGTVQADIYALGKVLYELSTGQDRCEFPNLPTRLAEMQDPDKFRELNQVILRACEDDPHKRYRKAEDLHADLLLLMAGKSVQRIRALEKRVAWLINVGVAAALILLVGGGVLYAWNRQLRLIAEQRQQQVGQIVAHGNIKVDDGDFFGALPFFCEALRLEQDMSLSEKNDRLRIGVLLELCPRMTRLLVLNGQHLKAADFSRDGRFVITAGRDGTATLCDLTQPSKWQPWHKEEDNELDAVSISPNGRYAAIAGHGFVKVWEMATDILVCSATPPGFVLSVKFTADGSQFVVASGDDNEGYVYLYNTTKPGRGTELTRGPAAFRWAALSLDGKRLVTAREDGIAQVWDLRTMQPIGDPIRHPSWVYCAAFSPDGRRVVTAGVDGTVKVCDAETGKLIFSLRHPAGVQSAEFSPDGRYIVTAGWDYMARIWDASTGQLIYPTLKQSGKFLVYVSFSPDGHRVLAVNANGVLSLWDLATPMKSSPGDGYVLACEDGHRLFAIQTNYIGVLDPANPGPSSQIAADAVREVILNKDGSRLVTLSQTLDSGNVTDIAQLWDTESRMAASRPFSLNSTATNAFLSDDGRRLITWKGKQAIVWDTLNGRSLYSLDHTNEVSAKGGCFSPHGAWLATISATNVYIWKGDNTNPWCILGHPDDVECVAFSPDNRLVVTCCGSPSTLIERDAQIWELTRGKKVGAPLHHADGVLYGEFSPDGKRVVTASEDATACVWEVPTGKLLLSLEHGQGSSVTEAHFSLDGRWIVTASREGQTARVWDAQTGEPLTAPLRHDWPFAHAQFVNDGHEIFTRRSRQFGGQTMLWKLPVDKRGIEELNELATVLSGHRPDLRGAVQPQTPEDLQKAWEGLLAKHPGDFSVSLDDIINWDLREAKASEGAKQWSAAVFHWNHLIQAKPDNQIYQNRLNRARDLLNSTNSLP